MKNNLKQVRNSKHLLQTKVAMDLNITQETISSYETGRVFPYQAITTFKTDKTN